MQKVYLLLRHNAQTGPFDLSELLQFDLKPFDLIWIEGKSAGWYYPQEIEALRPHLPFLKKEQPVPAAQNTTDKTEPASPRKIFVSMPSTAVAKEGAKPQTAAPSFDAQPKRPPLFNEQAKIPAAASSTPPQTAEIKTGYAGTMDEAETDYTRWAYAKKTAKKPLFSKSGIAVLCLLSVALFAVWKVANKPKAEEVPSIASPEQTAVQASPSLPEKAPVNEKAALQKNASRAASKKETTAKNFTVLKKPEPVKNGAAIKPQTSKGATAGKAPVNSADEPVPVVKDGPAPAVDGKTETATTEAPKKKKLRDKILDIFRKKPEEKTEEAPPAENDNGRRQSTRREAGSSVAQMVAVKFDVPNSWMMGIKGARATLTNKSSEAVVKAIIEVRYYNDDNDLLDKKNIVFTNVKSKGTQTVPVPEHATATRLEYSVVSAVGAEPLAKL